VSLKHSPPQLRNYRIVDGVISETEITRQ